MLKFRHHLALIVTAAVISQAPVFADADSHQPLTVDVRRDHGMVVIDVDMQVNASPQETWTVLTDYDHMTQVLPDLRSSKATKQANGKLRLEQTGEVSYGPLSVPFDAVREIDLKPYTEIVSRAVAGSVKEGTAITHLIPQASGTRIVYHSESVPNLWVPPGLGPTFVKSETTAQFERLRNEILKRKAAAKYN